MAGHTQTNCRVFYIPVEKGGAGIRQRKMTCNPMYSRLNKKPGPDSFGHGLPRDFVLAYMWNNLAAAQGGAEAAKFRDVIAEAMTAQQIAEAQKLASDWLAAHPKL